MDRDEWLSGWDGGWTDGWIDESTRLAHPQETIPLKAFFFLFWEGQSLMWIPGDI